MLPYLTQVAIGIRNELKVFGNDYETKDGSCIRDFIHVVDLASAHLKAFEYNKNQKKSFKTFNIGTGNGISVLELIKTFEKVNSLKLNYRITKRRKGDIDVLFADCSYSEKELNWKAKFSIEEMLSSAWNFQQKMVK